MRIKRRKGIDGKLDKVWSDLVKARAGYRCEYCHVKGKQIHSHHIYSRANRSVRWDLTNGIALCASHHVLSSKFSAHQTPVEFTEWLYRVKGDEFMDELRMKAALVFKWDKITKGILFDDLTNELNEINENGKLDIL